MTEFPGIENLSTLNVYRSIGDSESRERIGFGFMDKSGVATDNINYRFPFYVIVYVLHGNGTYVDMHGQSHPLRPGNFFQRIPGERHSNLIDPHSGWKECFIEIGAKLFNAYRSMRIIRDDFRVGYIDPDPAFIERLWNLQQRLKTADEYMLPRLLPELLLVITEIHQKQFMGHEHRQIVDLACDHLSRDLERRIDLVGFCKRQGLGYESFRKKFKEQMGISPGQYRIRRRVDAACEMLNNHNLSIGEIAFRLGYKSQYEFSSQFKAYTGLPPRHFRASNKRLEG